MYDHGLLNALTRNGEVGANSEGSIREFEATATELGITTLLEVGDGGLIEGEGLMEDKDILTTEVSGRFT